MRVGLDARLVARGLGIAQVVDCLARHLVDSVDVVWFGPRASAPCGVVDCIEMRGRPYPFLDSPLGWRLASQARVDIMHFTGNTAWTRRRPIPVVLTVHDAIFLRRRPNSTLRQLVGHAYLRRISPLAARHATAVVSVSHASAADIARRMRLPTTPLVIPNGVQVNTTRPASANGRPYAVAFAARDPRKQTAHAICGWRAVRDEGIDLKLLAGGGLPEELSYLLSRPPTGLHVVPYLPRPELEQVIAGADALIYPSEEEGFGLPVLEAMALGTPVIGGLAPATLEVGNDAILPIDRADVPGSIAAWLRRLAAEPDLRARISAAGRRRADQFTWSGAAQSYAELYERLLATRG